MELHADLRAKDLYISELEGELQAKRKKISTLSDQLVQTENELERLTQKNELERLTQKSKHEWQQYSLCKLISSPYKW